MNNIVSRQLEVSELGDGVAFGAKVTGLTLEHLSDASVRKQLYDLWIDRGVILFRGPTSQELHVELSRCFGSLMKHPFKGARVAEFPELNTANFLPANGTAYEVDGEVLGGWLPWHKDLIYTSEINHGGILRAIQLPDRGGKTGYLDQIVAYDRLPETLKKEIDGLTVVYGMDQNMEHMRYGRPASIKLVQTSKLFDSIVEREYQYPRVLHPMVYTQAETGRKVLNVSPWFALGVLERGGPKGEALLQEVVGYCLQQANTYVHEWRLDDMVLWDNWRTLHCSTGVAMDQTRVMQRTTISGDYALGRNLDLRPAAEPA